MARKIRTLHLEGQESKIITSLIFQLNDNDIIFPDPSLAEEDGLLAIGGDLSPQRLSAAYRIGIFPWFAEGDPICWYSPHVRCVIFKDRICISASMKKFLNKNTFTITSNRVFTDVIRACKTMPRNGQDGTWITDEMEAAYIKLYEEGMAQSVEVWADDELAGGIYGVVVNGIFCGESMFSKFKNASKAALIWLCTEGGFRMIDCQMPTEHLMRMGAEMISQDAFRRLLKETND